LSDEYVTQDYFYNEYEENFVPPQNFINISTIQPNYIFSFNVEKRFDDFFKVTQKIPELSLDIPDQRLWETPFYYSSLTSGTVFDKQYAGLSLPPEKDSRMDTFHKLSYVSKVGFLNVTPYATARETFYDRNRWETGFVERNAFGGGLDVSTRFHRVYDYDTDFLGLDINDIRHIIVPEADYFHLHQPSVDKDSLLQMDEIDELEKENGVKLSLENKFQTKRHSEAGELYSVDLVRFITSSDYLFRMKQDDFEFKKEGQFRDIELDLEVIPYSWLYLDGELTINPKNQSINTGSTGFSLHPVEYFKMSMDYRYEKKIDDPRNKLVYGIEYIYNPKWAFKWYERFDFQDSKVEEQSFTVIRDLHCWDVELTYDLEGTDPFKDKFTIWLAFKIKAFPDMQLGLSRSYTKNAPGVNSYRNR
jgi:hypothetical protein